MVSLIRADFFADTGGAYAMTWCSNSKTFSTSRDLAEVYQCSKDLFQSSTLALLSSAIVTISNVSAWPTTIKYLLYRLHWLSQKPSAFRSAKPAQTATACIRRIWQ